MTVEVVRADRSEAPAIAGLIALAFQELPPTRWLIADPEQRAKVLPANFLMYVEHAFDHGHVDVTGDRTAAAVWFHNVGAEPIPPPPDYDRRLAADCGEFTDRFLALDEAFEAHHPHEPHHHLAFLAALPGQQSAGLGSALLLHHHRFLDAEGIAGYLEASTTRASALYQRRGYRPHNSPFHLPEDGPPFWPMWREPVPS